MLFCSIDAVGVDIAPFSAMEHEAEVLLLPGFPLMNHPGKNPEKDLWTFEIETPSQPVPMIDYVHPGVWGGYRRGCVPFLASCWVFRLHLWLW